jgi:hypothetical protein
VSPVLVSPSELFEAMDRFYHRGDDRAIGLPDDDGPSLRAGIDATPEVEESLFRELSEIDESGSETDESESEIDESEEKPSPETESAPAPAETPVEASDEGTNRTILRALCHLLIEKGVIQREELQVLVQSIQQPEAD